MTTSAAGFRTPPDWADAIARLREAGGRVLVLGPVDVGKSVFCRLLLAEAAGRGRRVALVDADPGQKTAGPPAAVTLARGAFGSDRRLDPDGLAFVGAVDALRAPSRIVRGVEAALARLGAQGGADLVAINTAGIVARPGHGLIRGLLAAARPDAIVAIGGGAALAPVLAPSPARAGPPVIALEPAAEARRKSAAVRARARRAAFAAYFAAAEPRRVPLNAQARAALEDAPERLLVGLVGEAPCADALGLYMGLCGEEALVLAPRSKTRARLTPGHVRLDEGFASTAHPQA